MARKAERTQETYAVWLRRWDGDADMYGLTLCSPESLDSVKRNARRIGAKMKRQQPAMRPRVVVEGPRVESVTW